MKSGDNELYCFRAALCVFSIVFCPMMSRWLWPRDGISSRWGENMLEIITTGRNQSTKIKLFSCWKIFLTKIEGAIICWKEMFSSPELCTIWSLKWWSGDGQASLEARPSGGPTRAWWPAWRSSPPPGQHSLPSHLSKVIIHSFTIQYQFHCDALDLVMVHGSIILPWVWVVL